MSMTGFVRTACGSSRSCHVQVNELRPSVVTSPDPGRATYDQANLASRRASRALRRGAVDVLLADRRTGAGWQRSHRPLESVGCAQSVGAVVAVQSDELVVHWTDQHQRTHD